MRIIKINFFLKLNLAKNSFKVIIFMNTFTPKTREKAVQKNQTLFELTPPTILLFTYITFIIAWLIATGYFLILDSTLHALIHNQTLIVFGIVFVGITGTLFYLLLKSWYDRLLAAHDHLQWTLDSIPDLLFELDIKGYYHNCHSMQTGKVFLESDSYIGKTIWQTLPPEEADICFSALLEANENDISHGKQIAIPVTGTKLWFELSVSRTPKNHGENPHFIILAHDITERKKAEIELRKLSQAVEQSPDSIVIIDLKGNIEYVNSAFVKTTGYTSHESIGKNPRFLSSGKTPALTYLDMWTQLLRGQSWQGEFINRYKDGSEHIQSVHISPVKQSNGEITNYIAIEEDITERRHADKRIHYLANYDSLTGLPNRSLLDHHLKSTLSLSKRNRESFALIFLDLDHFKNINDTLGHNIGDSLLVELARRLQSILRDQDIVARLGGDEFILLIPCSDSLGTQRVAQKILDIIFQHFFIDQYELIITASIGIALYPEDGSDIESLSKNADTAMYRAKQAGRNTFCFFTSEMQAHSARNLTLTNALHKALDQNQLYVVYQPQISQKNGLVIGVEALLRWQHPELGSISPAEFIPIAEESGLILPIGEWVLRTALRQLKTWMENGLAPITMSVNLSAVQFRHPSLLHMVTDILRETAVPSGLLELELTENVAMNNPQSAITIIENLHKHGVKMSIDDFGTGYSSLSYLKKFKVYKLKIDQSFVRDICIDPEDKAIVKAIINMAHSLGLKTIAEGVETADQLRYLSEQSCNEIQGYYFSRPLAPDAFEAYAKEKSVQDPALFFTI